MTVSTQVNQTLAGLKMHKQVLKRLLCRQIISRLSNCIKLQRSKLKRLLTVLNHVFNKLNKKNLNISNSDFVLGLALGQPIPLFFS